MTMEICSIIGSEKYLYIIYFVCSCSGFKYLNEKKLLATTKTTTTTLIVNWKISMDSLRCAKKFFFEPQ